MGEWGEKSGTKSSNFCFIFVFSRFDVVIFVFFIFRLVFVFLFKGFFSRVVFRALFVVFFY